VYISYSRDADAELARRLQAGLAGFARPWYRRRALPVVCPEAGPAATPSVHSGLAQSESLVVLCSRAAAVSDRVRREIEYWREHQPVDRVLLVLADGDLRWDPATGDFDPAGSTALPPSLRGAFATEPRWVDLRRERKNLRDGTGRRRVAEVAAALRGSPTDELVGLDRRLHRANRIVTATTLVVLVALIVGAVVVTVDSRAQARNAERARAAALAAERAAIARSLAEQAAETPDSDPATALRLAIAAAVLGPAGDTHNALVRTLGERHFGVTLPGGAQTVTFAGDHLVLTGDATDTTRVWDITPAPRTLGPRLVATLPNMTQGADPTVVSASADGSVLLAAAGNSAVLWSIANPTAPRRLAVLAHNPGGQDPIDLAALSPDARLAVTAGRDGVAHLWDLSMPAAPKAVPAATLLDHLSAFAFAPTGSLALAASSRTRTAQLWNLTDAAHPHLVGTLTGAGDAISAIGFSADMTRAITGDARGGVIVWDLGNQAHPVKLSTLDGHSGQITAVALSRDGRTALTGSADRTVRVWDLADPARPLVITTLRLAKPVTGAALDQAGTAALTAAGDATLWRVESATRIPRVAEFDPDEAVNAVALSPDGSSALTGSEDATRWDLSLPEHPTPVATLIDSAALAGNPPDAGHAVTTLAWSPDGSTVLVGGYGGRRPGTTNGAGPNDAVLWDMHAPASPHQLAVIRQPGPLTAVTYGPSGTLLAASGAAQVGVFSAADGKWIGNLAQDAPVTLVAADPRGPLALTGGGTNMTLWDLSDPTHPQRIAALPTIAPATPLSAAALSPGGRIALTGGVDGRVAVWDLSTPTKPVRRSVLTDHRGRITAAAASIDGRLAITADELGLTIVWDLSDPATPLRLASLDSGVGGVTSLAISNDGKWAVTGTSHGAVLWDLAAAQVAIADPVAAACLIAGRGLDQHEWARYAPGLDYQETCPQ
jgi:WD40 repeat protein